MDADKVEVSPALWKAVWGLAEVWSETPVVRDATAALPRNRPVEDRSVGATGLPAFLHNLELRGGAFLHPFMYGSRIPVLLQDPMIGGGMRQVDQDEVSRWLQSASRVEQAHRITLGWLRSSLAGYPILRAPQLAPGTPLTTHEMTRHFIWAKEEFAAGLNRQSAPPEVPNLLGAVPATHAALDEAARKLATQLRASPAWTRFDAAAYALGEDAKTALRQARHELTERLSNEWLEEYEANLAVPRMEYRAHTTADVIDTLTGPARSYADAFTEVHTLLTLTACHILSELTMFGEPWPVPVTNVDAPEPGQPIVEFESTGAAGFFMNTGQVVWLGSSAVPDAVRIERMSVKNDLAQGNRDEFRARVLLGTGEGWPAPSTTLSPTSK